MKTVLCYGDSNTWGWNPATKGRYSRDERWPGVVRQELGEGYYIIEEGLNGRTTVWNDPIEGYKNGKEYLIPCLATHAPLELVVIMLGTNDLKMRFSLSAFDVAQGAGALVDVVRMSQAGPNETAPEVLMVCPPPLARLSEYADMFEGGLEKSKKLAKEYRRVAEERGCHILNAGDLIVSSDLDGIHLDLSEQRKLGQAVAARVREILG